jgi:hypothetical protein
MLDTQERVGEIVAAHRLARDILILIGWSADVMANDGLASLDKSRRERGRFRAASWPAADASGERWFLAAIRVAEVGEARPGEYLLLDGVGAQSPMIACLPHAIVDGQSFAAELKSRLGRRIDEAAQFLLDTLSNRASRQLKAVSAFLGAVVDAASEEDGVIEVLGAIEGEGLFMQGWLRHPSVGKQRLLLNGDELHEHDAICATFARADLEAPAVGFVAIVRADETGIVASSPGQVHIRIGGGFRRLVVLPNAVQLHHDQATGHLRDRLPGLRADETVQRAFRTAARPRFNGCDTVSSLDRPVRMAIDVAAPLADAGWYLTGWLLDPANLVLAVTLRGADGSAERLDLSWTRVAREDVSRGFCSAALFEGLITHDQHGFTVFVPNTGKCEAWLELTLVGEHCVFMPLNPLAATGHGGRLRLLGSFDIHKPSAGEIVERHLGPFFHAAKSSPKHIAGHRLLRPGSALEAGASAPSTVLIVPLTDPGCRTNIVVAGLANCDPGDDVAPLLVCSPALAERTAALLREIEFYDIDVAVLVADEPVDACDAIEIGVRATAAPMLVFLSPSSHPLCSGWAASLVAALGDDAAAASPTLLYEDWSVRYAGIDGVRFLDNLPYAEAASVHAGYPRGALTAGAPAPTLAASLECCSVRRSAFVSVGGFGAGYALTAQNGLDFFLRLRAAGMLLIWLPTVEAYALDDPAAAEGYWVRTGEMVDGWSLRASWRDRLPGTPDVLPTATSQHISVIDANSGAGRAFKIAGSN